MDNDQNESKPQPPAYAVVRAVPFPPHKRRWGGLELWVDDPTEGAARRPPGKHALPWPAFDVKVAIVSSPKPFDPNANGGVPQEVSLKTLRMLEKDERILVRVLGAAGDPAETFAIKAELIEQEAATRAAQRDLAQAHEQSAFDRQNHSLALAESEKRASKLSVRAAELEAEVALLRAQLSERKAVKK